MTTPVQVASLPTTTDEDGMRAAPRKICAALLLVFVYGLLSFDAIAATATASPSSCTNNNSIGTVAWTTPTLAYASDNAFAQAIVDGTTSRYLYCTGYGFTLPAGAVIQGITVNVERKSDRTSNGGSKDAAVRLIKAGAIGTTDKSTATIYTTTDVIEAHGSTSDLWGTTWIHTDINAANFGVAFAVTKADSNGPSHVVDVDHIQVVVTYLPATTLADGTNPSNVTLAPSGSITDLDSFTLTTSSGADSVTGLTVTLAAGTSAGLSEVRITSSDNATTYFSVVSNPGSDTVAFSGGSPIPVTTTTTTFKVRITPKTHGNMPGPLGSSYAVTGTVTAFTSTNAQVGTDGASATVTVDNLSPTGATATSGSAGNAQVTLNWTTSASADFSRSVMLRWTGGSAGAEVPAEGTDYAVGNTIGTATVVCVRTADATGTAVSGVDGAGSGGCSATALTNGQAYTYSVFQKDSNGNYDTGVTIGTFTPAVAVSSFNVVETGASATAGKIFTKIAGQDIAADIVALDALNNVATGFTGAVKVELVDNTGGGACAGLTQIKLLSNETFTGGNAGRHPLSTGQFEANAWRNVKFRISYPTSSPTVTSCSTDNFSIRPTVFTVSSTDATNTGASGPPAIKVGASFNLTATSVAGYDGTPSVDNTAGMVVGTPAQGAIGGSFSAASIGTGTATGATFTYSEVGNFGLSANAVFDSSFTGVDASPSDCNVGFSNTLDGAGRYGCSIGSTPTAATAFGRFIPDNFLVTYNAPVLAAACGIFSYVGQSFAFTTGPVMTVTARNGATLGNGPTLNYAGAYMKLTNTSLLPATQAARYVRFDALGGGLTPALDTAGLPATTGDPAIGSFASGVGSLTFSSGSGLGFTRSTTTPNAPFNADIALTLNVIDTDNITFAGNPASFGTATSGGGVSFSGGKTMRFGRLRLQNALGSELLDLPIPMVVQFWNGTTFTTNPNDSCTSLSAANLSLGAYSGGITGTNLGAPGHISIGAFVSGVGNLKLTKPSPAPTSGGSATLTVDLSAEAKSYLKGNWVDSTYTANPSARVTFGLYGSQPRNFIFFRENY